MGKELWLVGAEGFEPTAPASQTLCATRLRYAPTYGSIADVHLPVKCHLWRFRADAPIETPSPPAPLLDRERGETAFQSGEHAPLLAGVGDPVGGMREALPDLALALCGGSWLMHLHA